MVPAGYMPAAWGDGGPITLCPMGLPASLLPEHSGHHHDDGDDGPGAELLWEHCPLGALTDTASIIPEIGFHLPVFLHIRAADLEPARIVSRSPVGFRSRAPPSSVA